MANTAFELRNITKIFGELVANEDVSFSVSVGSLHGVVGENGAGKSTIMKVLYGMYQPDMGEIHIRGKLTSIPSPHVAIQLGIGMVHQHFMLVPTLTVWQNIILGKEPTQFKLDKKKITEEIEALQSSFGFRLDLNAIVENLPVGSQQQVEILKLLYRQADILILDEPTAVLTPQEVDALFERLKTLANNGKTIVLISHKLREILQFTERVTVMRQGRVVSTTYTKELGESSLAELIVGRKISTLPERASTSPSSPRVQVNHLSVAAPHGTALKEVSFQIRPGEIVGIAGVSGNGQQELIEVLAGVRRNYDGSVTFDGKEMRDLPLYPLKQDGLSVIPPDRHLEAMILDFPVRDNFLLGHHKNPEFTWSIFLDHTKLEERVKALQEAFDVRPRNPLVPIRSLSGGNQQKVIIAREIQKDIKFLIAAYPTRGVDIGAIEFIHSLFLKERDKGAAILLVSAELDEILALSDRILVLYGGQIVGEVSRENATESQIGCWMTGMRSA